MKGVLSLLVIPQDSFADAIVDAMTNPNLYCIAKEAREFIVNNYSLQAVAHGWENLFNETQKLKTRNPKRNKSMK